MTKLDIITGFLGAGKTTFIEKYLSHLKNEGKTWVYLVNDFGEYSIDDSIIQGGGNTIALSNGCVCCTLKTEFLTSLCQIISQFKPDHIVFEPSGVFLINDIFQKLADFADCKINSIVCIVDGQNFLSEYEDFELFLKNQIYYCSNIFLSKSPSDSIQKQICDLLMQINPSAKQVAKPFESLTAADFDFCFVPKTFQKAQPHFAPQCFSKLLKKDYSPILIKKIKNCFESKQFGNIIRAKAILQSGKKTILLNVVNNNFEVKELSRQTMSKTAVMGSNLNVALLDSLFG